MRHYGRISCKFDTDHVSSNGLVGENLRFFQKLVTENRIRYSYSNGNTHMAPLYETCKHIIIII